jgi:gas vesicle protein
MRNSSKILIGVGLGAVIGGIAGYYMNSAEGKKMQKNFKKQAAKIRKDVTETLENSKEEILSQVNQVAGYTKEKFSGLTSSLRSKFDEAVEETEETADDIKSRFQAGVEKAKSKVKQQAEKIRSTDKVQA